MESLAANNGRLWNQSGEREKTTTLMKSIYFFGQIIGIIEYIWQSFSYFVHKNLELAPSLNMLQKQR